MTGFPLRYARRNVLIGPGGEAAALYRADTIAYPFLLPAEKWALLRRLERFAHLAAADFSIWRVQRAYPAERYAPDRLWGHRGIHCFRHRNRHFPDRRRGCPCRSG